MRVNVALACAGMKRIPNAHELPTLPLGSRSTPLYQIPSGVHEYNCVKNAFVRAGFVREGDGGTNWLGRGLAVAVGTVVDDDAASAALGAVFSQVLSLLSSSSLSTLVPSSPLLLAHVLSCWLLRLLMLMSLVLHFAWCWPLLLLRFCYPCSRSTV